MNSVGSKLGDNDIRLRHGAVTGVQRRRHAYPRLRTWALPADNHYGACKYSIRTHQMGTRIIISVPNIDAINLLIKRSYTTSKKTRMSRPFNIRDCNDSHYLACWFRKN